MNKKNTNRVRYDSFGGVSGVAFLCSSSFPFFKGKLKENKNPSSSPGWHWECV